MRAEADPRLLCAADCAVLLVIDLQGKIFEMAFNSQRLRTMADQVLQLADLFGVPVILTEQYPKGLGQTVTDIRARFDGLSSEKHLLAKNAFGCCGDQAFDRLLARVAGQVRHDRDVGGVRSDRPIDVIIAGIETHVCVQQTVLELLQRPTYRVVVLADCVGGRVKAYHEMALDRFRQCGAVLTNFESLAFEWTRSKDDPRFKRMSALVKQAAETQ